MHGSIEEFIIFFILHQVFRVEEINVFLKQFFFLFMFQYKLDQLI